MNKTSWFILTSAVFVVTVAGACGRADDGDARIATRVAEDRAVAATLTADALALAPTPTPTPVPPTAAPTATPQAVAQQPIATAVATSTATAVATSTATPVPPTVAPTATPIVAAVVPVDGSDGDGREILLSGIRGTNGRTIVLPGFRQAQLGDPVVFDDWLTARVIVFDTRLNRARDGNGIRSVTFEVTKPDGDIFSNTENQAPFCLFSGNDPLCPGIRLRNYSYDWPAGRYDATIRIRADDGLESNWFWSFCVERCE